MEYRIQIQMYALSATSLFLLAILGSANDFLCEVFFGPAHSRYV